MSQMGQSTKSLRSSPLRGGKSREAVAEESDSEVESSVPRIRGVVNLTQTITVSPLRQRMIEDMAARKLNPHTQRSHVYSCKRFAAWLKRSPDTATATRCGVSNCTSSRAERASVTAIGS